MRRKRQTSTELRPSSTSDSDFELEIIPGLDEFAQAELQALTDSRARLLLSAREDRVRFRYAGNPDRLLDARRSVAVHRIKYFDIPRPKALLGHQNFETLIGLIEEALAQ